MMLERRQPRSPTEAARRSNGRETRSRGGGVMKVCYGNNGEGDITKNEEAGRLEIIDLSGMSLDCLPNPSMVNVAAICKLDLSNNNLQSIPESLTARLLNAVVLDVHSNQLTSLPNSIGCLSKLKVLNVSGNLLDSLPKTIENCT